MFTKSKLSFTSTVVFENEFKPSIDHAFCVVSRMMFLNMINIDGSINEEQLGLLKIYELWSYIYYLYYYNHSSVETFAAMKNTTDGKASALLFYETVRREVENPFIGSDEVLPLDVNTLAYFINKMVHTYGKNMRNPVVDYLSEIVRRIMDNKSIVAKLNNNYIKA